jgi:heterotetrameric sarcosine oxidase gamma subunit
MSGLAFLTPRAASDAVSARSPMERLMRAAGARFERRDGWNIAVAFGDPGRERERSVGTVAFADRSHLAKLEIHATPRTLSTLELTPGLAARRDGAWWCPVTPERLLVLGEPASGLPDALTAPETTVVDVTCGLAALSLIGPGANELLARFCAIDVRPTVTPVGGFRPGSVARTPGYVLREAEQQLLVLVGWALGEYLYEVVSDAAGRLRGGPVGADALEELQRA